MPRPPTAPAGVRLVSTGHYLPDRVLSNADLVEMMDTSDEWIVQRTGIRERRVAAADEPTRVLAAKAASNALRKARMSLSDIDFVMVATATPEMACPSMACRVIDQLHDEFGATSSGAMDLSAACSGFVYGMNLAHELVAGGRYRSALVIGAERLTDLVEYNTRGRTTAILFGDAAGAAILKGTDEPGKGVLAQHMHSDARRWSDLYIPLDELRDMPGDADGNPMGLMRMNGRSVFKFAVSTFSHVIQQTLDQAGLEACDVDAFVCHQSNIRILEAARERFGLPAEKLPINIQRVGNTSAASVPVLLDELVQQGSIHDGQRVMLVAFGGGLTWASSLWQL